MKCNNLMLYSCSDRGDVSAFVEFANSAAIDWALHYANQTAHWQLSGINKNRVEYYFVESDSVYGGHKGDW